MSQSELAKKSGLSESYISRACRGDFKGIQQQNFERIARALSMTPSEFSREVYGNKSLTLPKETPEQILEKLRITQPITVSVYEDFPFHAGEPVSPADRVYHNRDGARGKNLEGYTVHGNCLEPTIGEGDTIIIDRDGEVETGGIVACLYNEELWLGRLRRIADEVWIENNEHRIKLEECPIVAPVIEVRRRLK